jgi:ferrochelatase
MPTEPKTAILLLNLGGPDCLENVGPFLYNLFSDPEIIRLPLSMIFQKPLAKWIAISRGNEARHNYAMMGGASPILGFTRDQAAALQASLSEQWGHPAPPVYIAMRYWHPFTEQTVDEMLCDGIERIIVLPMYPHFSYTTTGSSLNALRDALTKRNANPELLVIPPYFQHPAYLQAMADTVSDGLKNHCWSCPVNEVQVLFSAHSLPLGHVKRRNDPYPEQIFTCAETIMKQFFPNNPWDLCYQSRVGNTRWLGPATEGVLGYFAGKNVDNILLVPISFVSDHVETLVEIDRQYLPFAESLKIPHCHRAPALNTRPLFIEALAQLVNEALEAPAATAPMGGIVTFNNAPPRDQQPA